MTWIVYGLRPEPREIAIRLLERGPSPMHASRMRRCKAASSGASAARSPRVPRQTIPRRGNFARGSICVEDMARESNQHAAMPPTFDQIEGTIADQAQRAKTQLGLQGPLEMRRQQAHELQHIGSYERV